MDTTEIGVVAAKVMEDLESQVGEGELPDTSRIVSALVIYEVRYDNDEDGFSQVGYRVSEDRSVIALGLMERARDADD